MSDAKRSARIGVATGFGLAILCIWPQAAADLRGVKIMGPGELMFIVSLPVSLLTWLVWLLPATSLFGPDGGEIPRWVAYAWLAATPSLNWGTIGWLVGRSRDRRRAAASRAVGGGVR